jgi:hypothetical protein
VVDVGIISIVNDVDEYILSVYEVEDIISVGDIVNEDIDDPVDEVIAVEDVIIKSNVLISSIFVFVLVAIFESILVVDSIINDVKPFLTSEISLSLHSL